MIVVVVACVVASAPAETTVRERRPADFDEVRLDDDDGALGSDALLAVPGVSLVREGGPLAPVRPMVRGLSGARLDVKALGLPFVDPAAGAIDAALWPWMLGAVDVDVGSGAGLGGGLAFKRPTPGVRLSLFTGELATLSLGGRAVRALDDGGVVGVAGSGGFTEGNFLFRPIDVGGDVGGDAGAGGAFAPALRDNNDQRRASLATFADVGVAHDLRLRAGLVGAAHDGGIAGFSTQPLPTLRGRRGLASAGLGLSWHGPVDVDIDAFATSSLRATTTTRFPTLSTPDPNALIGRKLGGRVEVSVDVIEGAGYDAAGPGFDVELTVALDGSAADIVDVVRRQEAGGVVGVAARGPAFVLWGAPVVAFVDGDLGARVVDDVGAFLPTGAVRLGLVRRGLLTFAGITRAARAPTLDERFAPTGFILGNAALRPESATDVEVGAVVTPFGRGDDDARAVTVRAVAFVSRVDDAISIVSRSAFAVVPVNTGPADRSGVELGGSYCPIAGLAVDLTASLLSSRLLVTDAPLPQAPPFLLRAVGRVGDKDAGLDVVVTARGSSSANLFGTLLAPAYGLIDLVGRYPLSPSLGLTATLQNALDVQTARDTNLLPLPGRLVFIGLEVKT